MQNPSHIPHITNRPASSGDSGLRNGLSSSPIAPAPTLQQVGTQWSMKFLDTETAPPTPANPPAVNLEDHETYTQLMTAYLVARVAYADPQSPEEAQVSIEVLYKYATKLALWHAQRNPYPHMAQAVAYWEDAADYWLPQLVGG